MLRKSMSHTPAVPETSELQAAATYNVALAPTLLYFNVQLHVYNMYTSVVWSIAICYMFSDKLVY